MQYQADNSIFEQLFAPFVLECFSPKVAQHVADYRADADTMERLEELARRSTAGVLTPAERLEYEEYIQAIDLISILQAQARRLLERDPAA